MKHTSVALLKSASRKKWLGLLQLVKVFMQHLCKVKVIYAEMGKTCFWRVANLLWRAVCIVNILKTSHSADKRHDKDVEAFTVLLCYFAY